MTSLNNVSITQLGYIIALADEQHFGLAAKTCHVSQPTLSMQIQKLESDLGVMIFDRTKQPIIPTEIGKRIIEQARLILKETKAINSIISENQTTLNGELKLAIIPTIAPYLLPRFLPKFLKSHPGVHLHIEELMTHQIVDALKKDTLDAAILATPLHEDGIQETPLYYEAFYGYISDNHALSKEKKLHTDDLNTNDLWLLQEGHCFRGQVTQLCKKRKLTKTEDSPSLQFESGSLEVLKALVNQGLGLTLLPELALENLKTDEKKRVRSFNAPEPVREISLIQSRQFSKKKIIDILITSIRENIPESMRSLKNHKRIGLQ